MRIDTLPRDIVQSYPRTTFNAAGKLESVLTVLQMAEPGFPAASYHVRVYHEMQDLVFFAWKRVESMRRVKMLFTTIPSSSDCQVSRNGVFRGEACRLQAQHAQEP